VPGLNRAVASLASIVWARPSPHGPQNPALRSDASHGRIEAVLTCAGCIRSGPSRYSRRDSMIPEQLNEFVAVSSERVDQPLHELRPGCR
jgi:hypothetical protein